jgi:beta-glucosidase/6-phospho-beta-glucosidase/beta-galactosidase
MIIAHFKTVKLYREMGLPGKIGFVNHFQLAYGASLDEKDQAAAERDMSFYSNWYSDPIFTGKYPQDVFAYPYIPPATHLKLSGDRMCFYLQGELIRISNSYFRQ